jgi:hypothetical protein
MISIIIASVDEKYLSEIKKNVENTIGSEYEIIAFPNSNGARGLCELYNNGVSQAKYDIICFMHEDILIETRDWGKIVLHAFESNSNLGLLGIAGSTYKALSPSGWHCNAVGMERSHIIQSFKFKKQASIHHTINPRNEEKSKVACLDGVWFCTRKTIAQENQFDEGLFKGFHGYDIDFSLQVSLRYELNVRYDITIQHFSEGNFNNSWLLEISKLHYKWNAYLPIDINGYTAKERKGIEKRTFKDFIDKSLNNGIPKSNLYKILWNKNGIRRWNFLLCLKLTKYIIGK